MYFLSVLLLIVHLNSVLLLLDFLEKKNVNRFFVSFVSGITEIYENVPQRT